MQQEEIARKQELLALYRRRLHELDKKIAILGPWADPGVAIDHDAARRAIDRLEGELSAIQRPAPLPTENQPAPADDVSGLAIGATLLAAAVVLWFVPLPSPVRPVVAGILAMLGVLGIGFELERLQRRGVWGWSGCAVAFAIGAAMLLHLPAHPLLLPAAVLVGVVAFYCLAMAVLRAAVRAG